MVDIAVKLRVLSYWSEVLRYLSSSLHSRRGVVGADVTLLLLRVITLCRVIR